VSRPKRIWRIGMMSVNENMLNTADRMFRMMDHAIYPVYGDAYLLSSLKKSFMIKAYNIQI
jgi:hypothetical protein